MSASHVVRTRAELHDALAGSSSVVLVPTMGALHSGHEQLLRHGRGLGDTLVASIFVNPTQFAPGEDFDAYPRTLAADLDVCATAGVDVVFCPQVEVVYPEGIGESMTVDPGRVGRILEGATRPTHFSGVLTVVAKLFGLVQPDIAVFGEKDYQQLVLIRQMARVLCLDVDVVGCPIIRDLDGVALSSRNKYLSHDERARATALHSALQAGMREAPFGAESVMKAARGELDAADIDVDYVTVADEHLAPIQSDNTVYSGYSDSTFQCDSKARLLIAARVGATRLLDNVGLTLGNQ